MTGFRSTLIAAVVAVLLCGVVRAQENSFTLAPTTGHRQAVVSLSWSVDGRRLVTGGGDNTARVWDIETGALLRTLSSPKGFVRGIGNAVRAAQFVADRDEVVIAGSDGATQWDLTNRRKYEVVEDPTNTISALAQRSDGALLVTAGNGPAQDGAKLFLHLRDRSSASVQSPNVEDMYGINSLALSRDGKLLAFGGSDIVERLAGGVRTKGGAHLWSLAEQKSIKHFDDFSESVDWVALSPDGGELYAGSAGQIARRRIDTGEIIKTFKGRTAALSANGRYLATDTGKASGDDGTQAVALWDTETGEPVTMFGWPEQEQSKVRIYLTSLAFDRNDTMLAAGFSDGTIAIWGLAGRDLRRVWHPREEIPSKLNMLAERGDRLIIAKEASATVWNLRTGERLILPQPPDGKITSAAIDPTGTVAATATSTGQVRVWDATSGALLQDFHTGFGRVTTIAFSPDGSRIAAGTFSTVRIWRARDAKPLQTVGDKFASVQAVAFSPSGDILAVGDELGEVQLFSGGDAKPSTRLANPSPGIATVMDAAFDSTGQRLIVAYGNGYNRAIIYDLVTGNVRRLGPHQSFVQTARFDSSGTRAVTGSWDETAKIWDARTGQEIGSLDHNGDVMAATFTASGFHVLTYAAGTLNVWQIDGGAPHKIMALVDVQSGWAAVATSGQFDARDIESMAGLHWLMPNDPLTPLPPEIFMRDYFEPRLLPRLLACREAQVKKADACKQEFKAVRPLTNVNRAQPEVKILSITPETGAPDEVAVTVEVRGVERSFGTAGETRTWKSGAYDLRLFRDNQLVDQAPKLQEPEPLEALDPESDLARWRSAHRLVDGVGVEVKTFRNIRLPRREAAARIEFSAYAFNAERVKSATVQKGYEIKQRMPERARRAYVVAVGVSAYEDRAWDLRYADDDARRLVEVLAPQLKAAGVYSEIVPVLLLADWKEQDGARTVIEPVTATKRNVQAVLDILAGRKVDEAVRNALPNGAKLQRAGPDDLVLIAYSSHGYADQAGNFFLFPYDIGSATGKIVAPELLKRAISSAELSLWLRDLDAAELILVVDACHSAASVQNSEFKPGPMGSRGLGQLAYDKGMRILASTRADDVAWESAQTRQGLLSYALVHDGLQEGKADFRPKDGSIGVQEWLQYAAERVPQLYAEALGAKGGRTVGKGEAARKGAQGGLISFASTSRGPRQFGAEEVVARTQQPALFNYKRGDDPKLIARR